MTSCRSPSTGAKSFVNKYLQVVRNVLQNLSQKHPNSYAAVHLSGFLWTDDHTALSDLYAMLVDEKTRKVTYSRFFLVLFIYFCLFVAVISILLFIFSL